MTDTERNALVVQYLPACRRMAGLWGKHAHRAGLIVESESLYSEAYTYLLESIIPRYDHTRGVPLRAWINLSLRSHLSDYLKAQGRRQGKEIATDTDELCGFAALPEDDAAEWRADLLTILKTAIDSGVICERQGELLRLIGCGMSATKAGKSMGMSEAWGRMMAARDKRDIRVEVLNIAD